MTSVDAVHHPVAIIGAGVSGLALAYRLIQSGIRPRILDETPRIAETWRRRHDQLRLNTHRDLSRLPGRSMPSSAGPFPGRDAVVRYLETYERELGQPIDFNVRVSRIDRLGDEWRLRTTAGDIITRHVVMATGRERAPVTPNWPGLESFAGEVRHAAAFGDVNDYRDRRILVIGAGNSGVDVLNHLARIRTRELFVALRTGTYILPTRLWGVPIQRLSVALSYLPDRLLDQLLIMTQRIAFGDLTKLGVTPGPVGPATRLARDGVAPAIDDGFVAALKKGHVRVAPAATRFEDDKVVLANEEVLRPDIVICATGYSPDLEDLIGHLNVLDEKGVPRFQGAQSDKRLPGLWFLGMNPRLFGNFRAALRDSSALSKAIVRAEAARLAP